MYARSQLVLYYGDEKLFGFLVMRHSDASRAGLRPLLLALKSAYFWCVDFRDPTAFSRIMQYPVWFAWQNNKTGIMLSSKGLLNYIIILENGSCGVHI